MLVYLRIEVLEQFSKWFIYASLHRRRVVKIIVERVVVSTNLCSIHPSDLFELLSSTRIL